MDAEDLKARLLKPRITEGEVDIPGVGAVRVRGLTRDEVLVVRKATDLAGEVDGPRALVLERKMLAKAMLDPEMTEAEIGAWQAAAPAGELEPVVYKVQELSGMLDGANKEAYKSVRDRSGA